MDIIDELIKELIEELEEKYYPDGIPVEILDAWQDCM